LNTYGRTGANDAFLWKGTAPFSSSTKGEVSFKKFNNAGTSNDYTIVYLDNDGDRSAEGAIRLTGLHDLRASDFIL
jgi:serralysin